MRLLPALLVLFSITLSPLAFGQHDHGHFPSKVLMEEFADFIEDMLDENHPDQRDTREMVKNAVEHYKYAFMVSAPQEKKLEDGEGFTSQKDFNNMVKRYETLDLPMPGIGERLIELNNEHKLDEVQLEMAYRMILFFHDERVTKQIRQ